MEFDQECSIDSFSPEAPSSQLPCLCLLINLNESLISDISLFSHISYEVSKHIHKGLVE